MAILSQVSIPISLLIFIGVLFYIKDSKERKILEKVFAASYEFVTWRRANPDVYLGLSDTGKKLLSTLILSQDEFFIMFPFVDGSEHRKYLMSLFDELPPKPNKPSPIYLQKPTSQLVFY